MNPSNLRREDAAWTKLPEQLYTGFAEASLQLFRQEGSFPMIVPVGQDVGDTILAFQALGCEVQAGPRERWINVCCPRV